MDMDALRLDQQLCFPLYALSRQVTALYRPLLEALDLTYPQYLVMLLLWEQDEQAIKAIGERLWLDTGTLTPLLKRLEQKGLIHRARNTDDERVVTIRLTEAGRSLREQAVEIPETLRCQLHMNDEQLHQLRNTFNQLLQSLKP